MRRTIAAITTSRADYSHLYWPLRELHTRKNVDLKLLVTGAHLSAEFGNTVDEIVADGFHVDERVESLLSSDTDVGMAKTIGLATSGLADVLGRMRPDLLLIIADRYEMLAPASVALALRIPLAHIEGGEISEGAIDQQVRDALTKMSHVHFAPTDDAAKRIEAMGEEPWRIHCVGAPSLDHLRNSRIPDRHEVEAALAVDLRKPTIVVAHHPVTIERETTAEVHAVFSALEELEHQIVLCFPNADAGSRSIIERAKTLCASRERAHLFVNLNPILYWGLLSHASLMIGNSSSGVMETPAMRLPTVNIGFRQHGRTRAANIIDVPAERDAIVQAVPRAMSDAFVQSLDGMDNPYGDGHAGERIADVLNSIEINERLQRKRIALATSSMNTFVSS